MEVKRWLLLLYRRRANPGPGRSKICNKPAQKTLIPYERWKPSAYWGSLKAVDVPEPFPYLEKSACSRVPRTCAFKSNNLTARGPARRRENVDRAVVLELRKPGASGRMQRKVRKSRRGPTPGPCENSNRNMEPTDRIELSTCYLRT